MHAKTSPLVLNEVNIIASNIVSIGVPEGFKGEINNFDIEIDFDIFTIEEDTDARRIVISIAGNNMENPAPGYCFSIIAEGTFSYNKSIKTTKKDKDILLTHSAIPIMIGQVRSYLSTLTALGPFSVFLLPSIDMNYLLNKKNEENHKTDKQDKSIS